MAATVDKAFREVIEVGPLEILPEEHLARAHGRALMLSIRELRLLTELARRADRIMAREELFQLVWGQSAGSVRTVDNFVGQLRKRFEANPEQPRRFHRPTTHPEIRVVRRPAR